jgi:hypothetical protein
MIELRRGNAGSTRGRQSRVLVTSAGAGEKNNEGEQ